MPYEAALSDDPCPTIRTSDDERSRAAPATRATSGSYWRRRSSARGCSRISARKREPASGCGSGTGSGDDTGLTAEEDALDLEVVVEHDHVRPAADVEPARVS